MINMDLIDRYRPFLDFIADHEGTAHQRNKGYDTSFGNGILTDGEKSLSLMTLAQIDDLQGHMLAHANNRWNTSALGRYQIVRTTLRRLRAMLRLRLSEIYTPDLQDWLAVQLILGRGRHPTGLRQEWASLSQASDAAIYAAFDEDGRIPANSHASPPPPYVPTPTPIVATYDGTLRPGSDKDEVRLLQQQLSDREYQVGKIDGIYGSHTAGAVASFQMDFQLDPPVLGEADPMTRGRLRTAGSRPMAKSRTEITADDLRRLGSVTIDNADRTNLAGLIVGVLGALGIGTVALHSTAPATPQQTLAAIVANARPEDLQRLLPTGRTASAAAAAIIQQAKQQVAAAEPAILPAPSGGASSEPSPGDAILQLARVAGDAYLPGLGSLAAIALGALTNVYGRRIIARRVDDQRTGRNVGPLKTGLLY